MTASTRWFVVAALAALLGAAGLHFLVLAGAVRLWPAATHLTVFGWVTAMILAVSYHTMPVFSARDFPYPRLIAVHCGIFAAGVTLTTTGLVLVSHTSQKLHASGRTMTARLSYTSTACVGQSSAHRPQPVQRPG